MALPMPRPFQRKDGGIYLNVRVPTDLAERLNGAVLDLPIGPENVRVSVRDKVFVSLKTRDLKLGRARFLEAYAALQATFAKLRAPQPRVTHKLIVALAGEVYRTWMAHIESEIDPATAARNERAYNERIAQFEAEGYARPEAATRAFLVEPHDLQILALKTQRDLDFGPGYVATYEDAREQLLGPLVDQVLRKEGLTLEDADRHTLLEEALRAIQLIADRRNKMLTGDYSPDPNLLRFPPIETLKPVPVSKLVESYKAFAEDKIAPSTLRRYGPSLASLVNFCGKKDARAVTEDDLWAWAERRRDMEGISARTVNRNDLVAAAALFSYATGRDGGRLRADNPTKGVKLKEPRRIQTRDPIFRAQEAGAILRLARSVTIGGRYPKAAASRRWVPWICAYSGARVQEPCWLRKDSFRQENGIWVMEFPRSKNMHARVVPLHDVLIEEGLIDFVRAAAPGPLFCGDRPQKKDASRAPAEQRASELAVWVRANVGLDEAVDPNHAWRHSFITKATGKIDKRIANAICGHNKNKDASDGYYTATVEEMHDALKKFPRYVL